MHIIVVVITTFIRPEVRIVGLPWGPAWGVKSSENTGKASGDILVALKPRPERGRWWGNAWEEMVQGGFKGQEGRRRQHGK